MANEPSALVVVEYLTPVSSDFVAVTVIPEQSSVLSSRTVPVMIPVARVNVASKLPETPATTTMRVSIGS